MSADGPLDLETFLDTRHDLPDAGQWAELEAGKVVLLEPPDLDHGNVILNFSKAIASWTQTPAAQQAGDMYACFDLGLVIEQRPDTVRFPAVSFFAGGNRFEESDKLATETVPRVVTELASSSERRQQMDSRVSTWLYWGVAAVWVIDPRQRTLVLRSRDKSVVSLSEGDIVRGEDSLPGFEMVVDDLFTEPEWWTGGGSTRK